MMIRKACVKLFLKSWDCNINTIRHSALFINGPRATENFVYVTPHIDLAGLIEKKTEIQKCVQRRYCNDNLDKLQNLWEAYKELKVKKSEYDTKKGEISKELTKLLKTEPDSEIVNKLKLQISLIKDNVRKLKSPLWSVEEAVMVEALKVPNNLHKNTPDKEKTILYTHHKPPNVSKNHLNIGKELDLLKFESNKNYYLHGDAALFELGAKFYFSHLLKKNGFIQFSNPDFVKSVIVEGCAIDHTSSESTYILHHNEDTKMNIDSRLHLTGGGSLCSFMAYHAKNVIHSKALPLKYFAIGRNYTPSSKADSLFHVSQSSVVEFFGVDKSEDKVDLMLEELVEVLKEFYCKLGYHFRLSILPADNLYSWESMRVIVEMYASSLERYVAVANVSISGDFISKRLMYTYTENKESYFPHIISGTLLNVPKLLACVLEQDVEFTLPDIFKPEKWTM